MTTSNRYHLAIVGEVAIMGYGVLIDAPWLSALAFCLAVLLFTQWSKAARLEKEDRDEEANEAGD